MKQFLLVALMTVVGFLAGYEGRTWQDRHAHIPPPPMLFGQDFGMMKQQGHGPLNRAQLVADVEKFGPQADAFNKAVMELDSQFDKDVDSLLTPEQRAAGEEVKKKREADHAAHSGSDPSKPLSDEMIGRLAARPFHNIVATVILPVRFDDLNRTYKFDDAQAGKVMDLLRVRREKYLALVDSEPPPSIYLSRLAQDVSRIAKDAPKQ